MEKHPYIPYKRLENRKPKTDSKNWLRQLSLRRKKKKKKRSLLAVCGLLMVLAKLVCVLASDESVQQRIPDYKIATYMIDLRAPRRAKKKSSRVEPSRKKERCVRAWFGKASGKNRVFCNTEREVYKLFVIIIFFFLLFFSFFCYCYCCFWVKRCEKSYP